MRGSNIITIGHIQAKEYLISVRSIKRMIINDIMGDTACRLGGLHDYKGILIGSRTHRQIEIGRHTDSTKRINRIFGTISLGISSSMSIPSSIYTPFIQGTSFGSYTIIFGKVISLII